MPKPAQSWKGWSNYLYLSNMKNYSSIEVNGSFTDRQWETYWELIGQIQKAKDEPRVIGSWQELKRTLLADNARMGEVMLYEDADPAGRIRVRKRNENFIESEIDTKYVQPPLKLMEQAALQLLNMMEAQQIAKVTYRTSNRTIRDFLESIGARVVNHYFYYRLEREKANKEKINEWAGLIPQQNPSAVFDIYKGVPPEYIDEYAGLFISLLEDMPRDASLPPQPLYSKEDIKRDLKTGNDQRQMWVGLLFENNQMIGMTNLSTFHDNPYHAFQYMTGVRKGHRGRGLAQWMKAAMFNHLLTLSPQPEMIYTSTFSLNRPMQAINFGMGYELQREGIEYLLYQEELKEGLRSLSQA